MKLSTLFSEHAVLQRGISVPVWGRTKPRSRVRVTVGPVAGESISDGEGKFLVRLPPQPAGGPYTLTAETSDRSEHVVVQDVCVGEVWVCSGQSNMQWTFRDNGQLPPRTDIPGLRMLTVPNEALAVRQDHITADWKVASAATVSNFSAVAFHLGERLHRVLGVPVGLIATAWGGTRVEAWTSRNELMQNPDTAMEVERHESSTHATEF